MRGMREGGGREESECFWHRKHLFLAPAMSKMQETVSLSLSPVSSSSPDRLPATGGKQQPKARQKSEGRRPLAAKRSKPTPVEKPKKMPGTGPGRIRGSASWAIKKPLLQKPATGTSSGDYSYDSDYYDDVSETPEVPRKREGKGRSRRGSMAQPAASGAGASAKHVRRSRDSHSHKKPVTGGASSSGAAKTTGTGVPRYSLKKPVTDGKRKGKDDGKPQLPLAQPAQPASGGKARSSKDQKKASGSKAKKVQRPVKDEARSTSAKDEDCSSGGRNDSRSSSDPSPPPCAPARKRGKTFGCRNHSRSHRSPSPA